MERSGEEGRRVVEERGGNMAQKGSNYRILILIFYGRSDWQTIALLVTMLVRVDVQRENQNEDNANRDAEYGDHHYS